MTKQMKAAMAAMMLVGALPMVAQTIPDRCGEGGSGPEEDHGHSPEEWRDRYGGERGRRAPARTKEARGA